VAAILLVEDEANARRVMSMGLQVKGHDVTTCAGVEEAEAALKEGQYEVVLTDLRMHDRDAGLDVVRMSSRLQPDARVLLVTAYASAETAVTAMKEGAFDYLTKPVSSEELAQAVERALADRSMQESAGIPELRAGETGLIGSSVAMQRVRERLLRAARRDFTVLITGESGTGKEVAARFIHHHSSRASQAFVPVHCGAIPAELFESELFGHCRGAFTGAENDRSGLIEAASGGTLFLDEVGEMPLFIQVKLLRVLQEHCVRRVGEEVERQIDVRVIAATNRDLAEEVKSGHFREDLFYRLNVIPVHMPALRQCREDIPVLVKYLLARWVDEGEKITVTDDCMQRLMALPWLGNVRELENLLQRMLALSDGSVLDVSLLDEIYPHETADSLSSATLADLEREHQSLDDWLERMERHLILDAMTQAGGNITVAARRLGVSFRSLRYRLRKLGLRGGD